jgi:NADPH:quinone reductase-like Zn-dependent oxidoreductase
LQALRDIGGLREEGSALINGGAGGVGHFAVQIARTLGATEAATCGPSNVDFVESLGADRVIDYSREDFTRRSERSTWCSTRSPRARSPPADTCSSREEPTSRR